MNKDHHHLEGPSTPTDLGGVDSPPQPAGSQIGPILSKLQSVNKNSNGWQAKCPAHDDRRPSLSIRLAGDGSVLLKCHAGCTVERIVQVLGIKLADLFPRALQRTVRRRVVAEYVYRQPDGVPALKVLRYEPKDFLQQGWNGTEWDWEAPKPKLLYHLPELLAAAKRWVLLCEGEQDVDKLTSLGFLATCNPGGAGKWDSSYTEILRDHPVAILPDNDPPGRAHAAKVARALFKVGCDVRVVELPGLKEKEDVSDWLRRGHTADELKSVISESPVLDEANLNETEAKWLNGTQQQTAAEILTRSGFDELTDETSEDDIEMALRCLHRNLHGVDQLRRATVSSAAAKRLKDLHVDSPKSLVKTALSLNGRDEERSDGDKSAGKSIVLTNPDPWPDTVDGAELLDQTCKILKRFVVLPEGAAEAISLWIVHTYATEIFHISPRLAIMSPEKRCGKTTLLDIVQSLTAKPLPTSNVSAAAVFRTIEKFTPSLLIDEADTFLDNQGLRGILNSGHNRATAQVIRTVGDSFEPRIFNTFSPVAIALIGKLPATLEDRSVLIAMRRKRGDEQISRVRQDKMHGQLEPQRQRIIRWVKDNLSKLKTSDPEVPPGLNDRAADNWRPLLSIADVVGAHWPVSAREAAQILSGATEGENSAGIQLLADIRDLFNSTDRDRLPSTEMVKYLIEMEERPWPEWKKGKPLTVRQLARLLGRYELGPKVLRIDGKTLRGYESKDFKDAFSRYLPPPDPKQRNNPVSIGICETSEAKHSNQVLHVENPVNGCRKRDITDVTLREGVKEEGNPKLQIEVDL